MIIAVTKKGGIASALAATLVAVTAILILATIRSAQADFSSDTQPVLVLAPTTVTTEDGASTDETISFPVPPLAYGPFTVFVQSNGVRSGNVELNGRPILGSTFDSPIEQGVHSLKENNTLRIELAGKAGASLTALALGYSFSHANDYTNLPELPPASTTIKEFDWSKKGAVTRVKTQGQCGSDWAFSAIGVTEGWSAIARGTLEDLSEQQLVDCARAEGCNGGSPARGLDYVVASGSCSQHDYQYTGRDGICKKTCKPVVKPSKILRVPPGDDETLKAEVAMQPVSVVIDGHWLSKYKKGIEKPACGSVPPAFVSVLVVGFGIGDEGVTPYWLIKNSLGPFWGEQGYFKMHRGRNTCGITNFAVVVE